MVNNLMLGGQHHDFFHGWKGAHGFLIGDEILPSYIEILNKPLQGSLLTNQYHMM